MKKRKPAEPVYLVRLGESAKGSHLYELGIVLSDGRRAQILAHARNSRQADAMARRAGYLTTDCNMIG